MSPLVPKEVTIELTINRVDVVTKITELYKVFGKILGEFPAVSKTSYTYLLYMALNFY